MLYASALKMADKNLNVQYVRKYNDLKQTLGSFFVRIRLAGCTMVFTKELLDIAKKYSNLNFASESRLDHDALLCMLSLLYDRKILIDDNAYILHRRHDSAETSGGRGLMNRIRVEIKRIRERNYSYQNTANLLMQEKKALEINKNGFDLLKRISCYNNNFFSVIKLCFDRRISCGLKTADLLIRLKMLKRVY